MAVYEGMFILDPGRYSRDPGTVSQQISDLITQHGGTVLAARLWDERKLAYPIKGQKKGIYWLTYFTMPGDGLTGLERQCEINDDILRKLVLRVDDGWPMPSCNMLCRAVRLRHERCRHLRHRQWPPPPEAIGGCHLANKRPVGYRVA